MRLGRVILVFALFGGTFAWAQEGENSPGMVSPAPTLEEARLKMQKWIETQQIISKEHEDWRQGKEILQSRMELVKEEIAALTEKKEQAESTVAESNRKRAEFLAQNESLKSAGTQLVEAVTQMEEDITRLFKQLPEPVQTKLRPLYDRVPEDASKTHISAAERFQNVLGILNEINKTNNDLTVSYEVRTLANGKPSEVKVIYVGLAQAYYLSAQGEAGIGRPSQEGWVWEPSESIAHEVSSALEIQEGKESPNFVSLPVKIQ